MGMRYFLCQCPCPFDVAILRGLVPAAQQDDDGLAPSDEVDAVAGAVVDPHLADPVEVLHVTQVARPNAQQALGDPAFRVPVAQPGGPITRAESYRIGSYPQAVK
jgi:hypothetical protein